jgi:hypothetical protein
MRYLGTTDETLTETTTLSDIAKALNLVKKKEKENETATNSARASSAAVALVPSMALLTAGLVPMVQASKLEPFDGNHSNWVLWKSKALYALAQSALGPLLLGNAEDAQQYAKKYPGQDALLFNILAEALVGGSAKFVIHKAKKQALIPAVAAEAACSSTNSTAKKGNASGRVLWQVLLKEYSQGPRAFWILSDARQVLQRLKLAAPQAAAEESAITRRAHDHEVDEFIIQSANDYAQRFRSATETLEEFHQALPEAFLASTFVEHIVDERFDKIKQQLLQDITTKNLSLDDCITEVLMTEHMYKTQKLQRKRSSSRNKKQHGRKRTLENHTGSDIQEETKRRKPLEAGGDHEEGDHSENQPDETIS